MKIEMYSFYNLLSEKGIILSYCGPMVQDSIVGIAATLKDKLTADSLPASASMAIFSIFIEQIQNAMYYSAEREIIPEEIVTNSSSGVFVIGQTGNAYFMQCGNYVKNSQIQRLTDSINYINSLNKDELKAYYRERRKSDNDNPESRGAGLGLIEIARRATSPLKFEFSQLDNEYSFFSLYATVAVC